MSHIYEDDCCGSGILYLAAGCTMSNRKLLWRTAERPGSSSRSSSSGSRPCAFDHCIQAGNLHNSSSSGSSGHNAAAAAPPAPALAAAAAAGGQGGTGHLSVFRGWYSSSSSSSRPQATPDAGRVAILSWMADVMLHSDDITWLPLDLVNTR